MDALQSVEQLTITTNGAIATSTTNNACLDLFVSLPNATNLHSRLENAYQENSLTTLAIIFHCRSIHDGKKDKTTFYQCFFWLLKHHPRTALKNMEYIVKGTVASRPVTEQDDLEAAGWDLLQDDDDDMDDCDTPRTTNNPVKKAKPLFYRSHGYWKDLLNIVSIYALGDITCPADSIALTHPRNKPNPLSLANRKHRRKNSRAATRALKKMDKEVAATIKAQQAKQDADKRYAAKDKAACDRYDLRLSRQTWCSRLLETDVVYRALHFTVARLFADQLQKDLACLHSFNEAHPDSSISTDTDKYALANTLSFAAKWAPSLASAHDKYSLMATSIAELMFIKDPLLAQDQRAYRLNGARDLYRRQVLVPLRKALEITERKMSENNWKDIDFSHVPAVCMQNCRNLFVKHAKDEYLEFLQAVQKGKAKVAGGVLGPHDFVKRALLINAKTPDYERLLIDGQWSSYIRGLQDACSPGHALRGSLAVCDVSGSMNCSGKLLGGATAMHAAIGLSLTLMALAAPPFTGMMITFDSNPNVVKIDPKQSIVDQAKQALKAPWGSSTDLYKVFVDLLLPMAIKLKIKQEDMVKRLFVFTDMQFDACEHINSCYETAAPFDTLWQSIVAEYHHAGYEPPEIVWWNLAATEMPITAQGSHNTPGMAMVSGFSQNMLKTFMDGEQVESEVKQKPVVTPLELMTKSLSVPSLSGLQVYD
ncbi:hypothetical protein DM01DRAFT_1345469 [Hesseltinella vesiculosa]|uniref:Uncharacterized protein n=1 Tax=Hesseltinella vesiculosa TaxID=101127 RepID=A0A1X2GJF2_9FUNG|nr:hypothetical protein DM01DRAFT_1345469 [Hesseltinella vesiculosa]